MNDSKAGVFGVAASVANDFYAGWWVNALEGGVVTTLVIIGSKVGVLDKNLYKMLPPMGILKNDAVQIGAAYVFGAMNTGLMTAATDYLIWAEFIEREIIALLGGGTITSTVFGIDTIALSAGLGLSFAIGAPKGKRMATFGIVYAMETVTRVARRKLLI